MSRAAGVPFAPELLELDVLAAPELELLEDVLVPPELELLELLELLEDVFVLPELELLDVEPPEELLELDVLDPGLELLETVLAPPELELLELDVLDPELELLEDVLVLPELELLELLGVEPPEELLELLDVELAVLALLTSTVALVGDPKLAAPATAVKATPKFLPLAVLPMGTVNVLGVLSPSCHVNAPLVEE